MTPRREMPPGFELARENIGAGKSSRVSVVRRTADEALFAWKVPSGGKADGRDVFESLVRRSREWVRLGVAAGVVEFAPDGETLLQPYVAGTSLRKLFRESDLLSDPADPRLHPLADLFRDVVTAKVYVSGLNSENLIFDGERFQVIDSGAVRSMSSAYGAWRRQRTKLARHWVRFDGHPREAILTLLGRIEAALELPPAGLRARLSYFLFRR